VPERPTQGNEVIQFTETFLTLGGSFLGQPFLMLDWMKGVTRDIFALNPDGRRKHRTYLLGVPRKNAKSTLGAAIAVYMLCIDTADPAPQIISAAGDRKQAKLVFDEAKRMIQASPELSEICTIFRDEIRCSRTGGIYRAVSADAGLAHGLNPSCVIVDEYHVHKTDELYTALTTGSATRNQPLTIVITTAGHNLDGPLGLLYQYGRKVESGEVEDSSFGFTWYGPREDEDYDPGDEDLWKAWNPSWEIMNLEEFRSAYRTTPESQFIRYRLNGWTSTESAWFPNGAWESRSSTERPLAPGDEVVLGFDGAWKGDSTALVACRLKDYHLTVLGHWEAPPGDPHWRTPVEDVKAAVRDACRTYRVKEIPSDPFRFEQTLLDLAEEGLPIVEFPTNAVARMVPATQAFYEATLNGDLTHDGDPALARHIGNAVLKEDARGGRITKAYRSSSRHIDLAVAAVIAHHRARHYAEDVVSEPELLIL
jgi:phage terminase large subunit-like protein